MLRLPDSLMDAAREIRDFERPDKTLMDRDIFPLPDRTDISKPDLYTSRRDDSATDADFDIPEDAPLVQLEAGKERFDLDKHFPETERFTPKKSERINTALEGDTYPSNFGISLYGDDTGPELEPLRLSRSGSKLGEEWGKWLGKAAGYAIDYAYLAHGNTPTGIITKILAIKLKNTGKELVEESFKKIGRNVGGFLPHANENADIMERNTSLTFEAFIYEATGTRIPYY